MTRDRDKSALAYRTGSAHIGATTGLTDIPMQDWYRSGWLALSALKW